ncbi:GIY-YIG nuclease [Catovirus CTV1]|uniref:GIY-YIG nuclease n=1 Tax=Catovirus CTV1 TaxID=1977631 RepID=A0A1V0SBC4_9VIRU|nr:GIY-YIG nuclease [Catovirus CTV1]
MSKENKNKILVIKDKVEEKESSIKNNILTEENYQIHTKLKNGDIGEENLETGVIYYIQNTVNKKAYIGKAYSYEKHGKKNPSYYGVRGRFRRHVSNANSDNDLVNNECPLFYEDIRKYGKEKFTVETLKICSKKELRKYEEEYVLLYETHKPEIGYNFHIGDKKPLDPEHIKVYKQNKANSNASRAINGKLKQSEETKNLPPNINLKRIKDDDGNIKSEGYYVKIKLNDTIYHKFYMSKKLSMNKKLELCKKYLEKLKKDKTK